jgi:hypothetical protein
MSLVRVRALVALSLSAAGVAALLVAAHGRPETGAAPVYGYVCVGGKDLSGRPLPMVCVPKPVSAAQSEGGA